uniref:Uncharacterized protein n=1 Tax=Candidatus Kentrum eta TaxID=2126337 RepID=A0A450V7K9_9GAMM|nr:MAG: hypothetical protein BECKH772B_GA0070898_102023 [Candidatus Kentron sp. H]VFK00781.1 MAG: hypothetical protein BECKH772A_GA0070896_102023 [Candidatus Kentron sp. H]VFK04695.1 MAG: hypothetical protein BECKH772C_GA0070978_102003 [Candidatus Kentron sp. H]
MRANVLEMRTYAGPMQARIPSTEACILSSRAGIDWMQCRIPRRKRRSRPPIPDRHSAATRAGAAGRRFPRHISSSLKIDKTIIPMSNRRVQRAASRLLAAKRAAIQAPTPCPAAMRRARGQCTWP